MYLSYAEYQSYGGTLDETTFNDFEFEASTQVDYYTFNRLQKMAEEDYPEALKRCMYKLIQLAQVQASVNGTGNPESVITDGVGAGVASQSNDGVSISYNILSANEAVSNATAKSEQLIRQYLSNVTDSLGRKLLYRGIYPDE